MRMRYLLIGLICFAMAGGLFSGCRKKEQPDLDLQVLDQLKKAGADLSSIHDLEFYLYFPTEAAAREAANAVKDEGCEVKVRLGADDKNWLCYATKRMVPNHAELVRQRERFNEIARKGGGEYDGWETAVVK
jgi:regulator of ribonuclease activity B